MQYRWTALQAKLAMNDRAICFKFGKKQKKQGEDTPCGQDLLAC
jgi:hypothetical protein